MQKKGFSLMQLIFIVIIIGILAIVAVPKYQNLQRKAEISSLFKIVNDVKKNVPVAFVNSVELNNEPNDWNIKKYYHISGKGWSYEIGDYFKARGRNIYNAISYKYKGKNIVWIALGLGDQRMMAIWITCGEYQDKKLENLCDKSTSSYENKTTYKNGRNINYREKLLTF